MSAAAAGPTTSAKAIRIHQTGGPSELVLDDVTLSAPGPNQVLVELHVAGINYIDTYHRTGLYKLPLPATIGREAAGVVQAVGSDVKDFKAGDRVVYFAANSYATHALVDAVAVLKIAEGISFKDAAAIHLQGLTAHAFITDVYRVKSGDTILVHAAAGGVGNLLVQMGKIKGATVIGTVGSEEKAVLARQAGADHVINYNSTPDFAAEVLKLTEGKGVHAVYDGVGKSTFEGSLKSLRKRGTMITFGNASGPVPPVEPLALTAHGSIFLTRPTVAHFVESRPELEARVKDIHEWLLAGKLKQRVALELPLAQAKEAHEALESRKYAGKILLNIK
jgi:NADPH2:quinone reductase